VGRWLYVVLSWILYNIITTNRWTTFNPVQSNPVRYIIFPTPPFASSPLFFIKGGFVNNNLLWTTDQVGPPSTVEFVSTEWFPVS
jgi:hypothetical protein